MKSTKVLYLALGCISLAIGAIAALVPLLPGFPFLLLTAIFFSRGSQKVSDWFMQSKLYKDNLESYLNKQGMTLPAKFRVVILVTITMSIGFLMMRKLPLGQALLGIIWLGHLGYFIFGVKTIESPISLENK